MVLGFTCGGPGVPALAAAAGALLGARAAGAGAGREGARRAAAAEGRTRGYAAGGGTGEGSGAHQEASSDRVGAGLRGDGTAPRFYKKVDVVAMEHGGGWGVALDGRVLKTPKKQGRPA